MRFGVMFNHSSSEERKKERQKNGNLIKIPKAAIHWR
jgi:hypothetical protein